MEPKTYAVEVHREATDYILITATSAEEAEEKAQKLLDEGTETITLGDDGEDRNMLGAKESEPEDDSERKDLESNDEAYDRFIEDEGIFDPEICPSAPRPLTEGNTAHLWDETTNPITCSECGATKD